MFKKSKGNVKMFKKSKGNVKYVLEKVKEM